MREDEMWLGFRGASRLKGFVRPDLMQSRPIEMNGRDITWSKWARNSTDQDVFLAQADDRPGAQAH
jgi:hypothetical protein